MEQQKNAFLLKISVILMLVLLMGAAFFFCCHLPFFAIAPSFEILSGSTQDGANFLEKRETEKLYSKLSPIERKFVSGYENCNDSWIKELYDAERQPNGWNEYTYNMSGCMISCDFYNKKGNLEKRSEYTYDSSDKLILVEDYNSKHVKQGSHEYKYDSLDYYVKVQIRSQKLQNIFSIVDRQTKLRVRKNAEFCLYYSLFIIHYSFIPHAEF